MTAEGIRNQHVLVTGGGRGIGRAIALACARAGADVSVAARTPSELEATVAAVRALGRRSAAIVADVSTEAGAESAVQSALEKVGPLDVLVNNAASFASGAVAEMPVEDWDRVMATNLRGPFLVTRAVLGPLIARRSGSIVFISSTSGKRGDANASAYTASKFGLMGLAACLVQEVRRYGIRVIVVSPSSVDTSGKPSDKLAAEDVAMAVVGALSLPPRALVREIELWNALP